jgi:type I restriction enzyme S subunit
MKKDWELKKLKDTCILVRGPFGGSLKKSFFVQNGYAVYEQSHAIYDQFEKVRYFINEHKFNEMKRFEVKPGDLIMSCSGTIGKVAIAPVDVGKGIINQALLKITPGKTLNIKFLKYWMGSPDFQEKILENSSGAAIKNVASVNILSGISIPIPPLPEQQRIVEILDQSFAAIDQAIENTETNKEYSEEIYESYLNEIFGSLNNEWPSKKINEVCVIRPPKNEAKNQLSDNSLVSFAPMEYLGINQKFLIPIQEKKLLEVYGGYTYFAENDVLLAKITPCFENGKLGIAKNLKNSVGFGSSEYIVFRPTNELRSEFLYYYLSREKFRDEGTKYMQGAVGHKRVSLDFVSNYSIPIPSLQLQDEIIKRIDILFEKSTSLISNYGKKIRLLQEFKQSILHKAFNGEL